jgi:hypothetical protein
MKAQSAILGAISDAKGPPSNQLGTPQPAKTARWRSSFSGALDLIHPAALS